MNISSDIDIKGSWKNAPWKNAPEKSSARKLAPGKFPPGKLPSPIPKIKYFVKLPHVMEYLNGETFVNFNFRGLKYSSERKLRNETVLLLPSM